MFTRRHFALALSLAAACATLTACGGPMDTTDGTDNTGDTDPPAGRVVTGQVAASASAKLAPFAQSKDEGYLVIAVSATTQAVYQGVTDANGEFSIDVPEDEGDLYIFTIVNPFSHPMGPVLFGQDGAEAYTGLELDGDADLGVITLPDDADQAPIEAGAGADFGGGQVATDVVARVDDAGVPVGVPNLGKGGDAEGETTDNPRQRCDMDRDGSVDLFDADNDGDGVVDDFDDAGPDNPGERDGLLLNFFMNLKVSDTQAEAYFSGDTTGIESSLQHDTVITFEVRHASAGSANNIAAVRVIGPPAPAPPYLAAATVLGGGLWADSGYALNKDDENHFQQFVTPNDFINAGDTFTVEVTFDDGARRVYRRMINYVFKSIPRPVRSGAPGALQAYDGPGELEFDGDQDLVIEWNPPVDETGAALTGVSYFFEVFYNDEHGAQIQDINGAATWALPPVHWRPDNQSYEVAGADLALLSEDNTFTVTLPSEIFVDTVQTSGGPIAVASYKIDVAAQSNGNNSAFMMNARKQ